jgi:hypothetical protein
MQAVLLREKQIFSYGLFVLQLVEPVDYQGDYQGDYRVADHCFEVLAIGVVIYRNCYGLCCDFSVFLQPQLVQVVAPVVVARQGTWKYYWNCLT